MFNMFFVRKYKTANALLFSMITPIIFINLILSCNATTRTSGTGSNHVDFDRTSKMFKENCTCQTNFQCECCAKVDNNLLNIHQTLCADWIVFANKWNVQFSVRLNENVLYRNTFSVWEIPPFCVLIWPALALTGCLQMHSITQHEDNSFHGCANATINFITFKIVNFQIVCMDIGVRGIYFVDPNHSVAGMTSTEKPPEIELETSDLIKLTTPPVVKNTQLNEDVTVRSFTIRQDSLSYLKSKDF